jgi:hypothetical protein
VSSKTGMSSKNNNSALMREAVPNRFLHPAWLALIRYCAELKHGELEVLKIQDGLPVMAEITKKKIRFVS